MNRQTYWRGPILAAAFLMIPLGALAATGGHDDQNGVQNNDEPMTPNLSEVTATIDDAATASTSGNAESAHLPRASTIAQVPDGNFNRLDASATCASTTHGTAGANSSGCLWIWEDGGGANDDGHAIVPDPNGPNVTGLLLTFSSAFTAPIANSGGANDQGSGLFMSVPTAPILMGSENSIVVLLFTEVDNSGGMNANSSGNSAENTTAYAVPDPNGPGYTNAVTSTAGLDNSAANPNNPTAHADTGQPILMIGFPLDAISSIGSTPNCFKEGGLTVCKDNTASNGM